MSLFPSAFETPGASTSSSAGAIIGSSSGKTKPQPDHKRKRSSLGGQQDAGKGKQLLRGMEANVEKLMKQVEKGTLREKETAGREAMGGGMSKKQKKNKRRHDAVDDDSEVDEMPRSAPGQPRKKQDGTPARHDAPKPQQKTQRDRDSKVDKPKSTVAAPLSTSAKPPPAEIPLPHTIPAHDLAGSPAKEGLTSMQKNMQAKLEGARFRWINEQLYSTKSTEAVAMMRKDPKIFSDYHLTHRSLTSAWPSPPLPHILALLNPFPSRTVIVDLGCGDAGLAKALVPQGKVVLSYDLVGDSGVPGSAAQHGGEGWVIEADFLESVPLPGRAGGIGVNGAVAEEGTAKKGKKGKKGKGREENASEVVDAVVCCLSLMGVNWVGGIYEACRILKQHGTLHIAEVTSRFVSTEAFVEKVSSFGFELEHQESPSSHFTLFRFVKQSAVPVGPARGQSGWDERVREGEGILRGCVYKKR